MVLMADSSWRQNWCVIKFYEPKKETIQPWINQYSVPQKGHNWLHSHMYTNQPCAHVDLRVLLCFQLLLRVVIYTVFSILKWQYYSCFLFRITIFTNTLLSTTERNSIIFFFIYGWTVPYYTEYQAAHKMRKHTQTLNNVAYSNG